MTNFVVTWCKKNEVSKRKSRFSKFEDALTFFLLQMGDADKYLYVELQANHVKTR